MHLFFVRESVRWAQQTWPMRAADRLRSSWKVSHVMCCYKCKIISILFSIFFKKKFVGYCLNFPLDLNGGCFGGFLKNLVLSQNRILYNFRLSSIAQTSPALASLWATRLGIGAWTLSCPTGGAASPTTAAGCQCSTTSRTWVIGLDVHTV